MYIYILIFIHSYIHAFICTYRCVCVCVYVHIHMHMHLHMHMLMHLHVHIETRTRIRLHMHVRKHIHTCTGCLVFAVRYRFGICRFGMVRVQAVYRFSRNPQRVGMGNSGFISVIPTQSKSTKGMVSVQAGYGCRGSPRWVQNIPDRKYTIIETYTYIYLRIHTHIHTYT